MAELLITVVEKQQEMTCLKYYWKYSTLCDRSISISLGKIYFPPVQKPLTKPVHFYQFVPMIDKYTDCWSGYYKKTAKVKLLPKGQKKWWCVKIKSKRTENWIREREMLNILSFNQGLCKFKDDLLQLGEVKSKKSGGISVASETQRKAQRLMYRAGGHLLNKVGKPKKTHTQNLLYEAVFVLQLACKRWRSFVSTILAVMGYSWVVELVKQWPPLFLRECGCILLLAGYQTLYIRN